MLERKGMVLIASLLGAQESRSYGDCNMRVTSKGRDRDKGDRVDVYADLAKCRILAAEIAGENGVTIFARTLADRRYLLAFTPADIASLMLAAPPELLADAISKLAGTESGKNLMNLPAVVTALVTQLSAPQDTPKPDKLTRPSGLKRRPGKKIA